MAERESVADRGGAAGRVPAVDEAREMIRNLADQQMHKLGSRLGGIAQALHDTARQLERQHVQAGTSLVDELIAERRKAGRNE